MPNRKKNKKLETKSSDAERYELMGRKLACLGHPFGSPRMALTIGLKFDKDGAEDPNMEQVEQLQQVEFYHKMLLYSPTLEDDLKTRGRLGPKELQDICGWIAKGMGEQHLTDLGAVKHTGLTYLMANHDALNPPISKKEDKSDWGFNYPQIVHMLCPCKKLVSFDEDPDVMIGALQEGQIKATASNWLTIFYEDGVYDPNNRLDGLFHGHAAFRFYTHLFIGPSAAATDTVMANTARPSKNRLWGLTSVTPEIIAYVYVMLYFTLTTVPRWCAHIGQMNLDEMASQIIFMFAEQDDWTHSTLAWWNTCAFLKSSLTQKDDNSDNDITAIHAQHASHGTKAKQALNLEHRAAKAIEFGTPPPEDHGPSPNSLLSTSVTSVFDPPTLAGAELDLSSMPLDNEGDHGLKVGMTNNSLPTKLTASAMEGVLSIGDMATAAEHTQSMTSDLVAAQPAKPKKKAAGTRKTHARKNSF